MPSPEGQQWLVTPGDTGPANRVAHWKNQINKAIEEQLDRKAKDPEAEAYILMTDEIAAATPEERKNIFDAVTALYAYYNKIISSDEFQRDITDEESETSTGRGRLYGISNELQFIRDHFEEVYPKDFEKFTKGAQ